ncbi:winged helix-turn-helix transcriptional regulator [Konateibacter massiliensis]|uniref:winged helix-turn-helix transcriptional regulator n=1 Tax=Konateibacter massiliensis TaxID=2002841 RepID=UPI000C15866C|nr:helix-turn-helix domain-containing protein [Konateibacter massiliensis]
MYDTLKCPVTYALSILDGKWKLSIVWVVGTENTIRFNELKRKLDGISNIMLSKSLQELENDHIVIRKQYNEIPPRVEYSLTDLGISLIPSLDLLGEWGKTAYALNHQD